MDNAYKFYLDSKSRLADGGFNLRKIATNSVELRERISESEQMVKPESPTESSQQPGEHEHDNFCTMVEEEQSTYTGSALGPPLPTCKGNQKILGMQWDADNDNLIIDVKDVAALAKRLPPTKRNVISVASKVYDPIGFICPITIQLKLLFQEICEAKGDWDNLLEGTVKHTWQKLVNNLQQVQPVNIPRCYLTSIPGKIISYELHGFCDASAKAYGAVMYLRITTAMASYVRLVIAKARVVPLAKQTIPRLELLSALILARLMNTTKRALEAAIEISQVRCWTDSKVALFWIVQQQKESKQYVQNRAEEIRSLVPLNCWNHCPGLENPADIPSRGITPTQLASSNLWWNGPSWLATQGKPSGEEDVTEMKIKEEKALENGTLSALLVHGTTNSLSNLINCKDYSRLDSLLRVTALVVKFVKVLKSRKEGDCVKKVPELTSRDIEEAQIRWIRELQCQMKSNGKFKTWNKELQLFTEKDGLMRCEGHTQSC